MPASSKFGASVIIGLVSNKVLEGEADAVTEEDETEKVVRGSILKIDACVAWRQRGSKRREKRRIVKTSDERRGRFGGDVRCDKSSG